MDMYSLYADQENEMIELLLFIVSVIIYAAVMSYNTMKREHQEWLDSQHEVRRHVTDNKHHSHYYYQENKMRALLKVLILLGLVVLGGCKHCPVDTECTTIFITTTVGSVTMIQPYPICTCPVPEVENDQENKMIEIIIKGVVLAAMISVFVYTLINKPQESKMTALLVMMIVILAIIMAIVILDDEE